MRGIGDERGDVGNGRRRDLRRGRATVVLPTVRRWSLMRPPVRGASGALLHAYRDFATPGDERQRGTTHSPCYPPAAFSFEDQPRRLQACAFTVPGWNVGT